jgi:hypothetical protein
MSFSFISSAIGLYAGHIRYSNKKFCAGERIVFKEKKPGNAK